MSKVGEKRFDEVKVTAHGLGGPQMCHRIRNLFHQLYLPFLLIRDLHERLERINSDKSGDDASHVSGRSWNPRTDFAAHTPYGKTSRRFSHLDRTVCTSVDTTRL